jgi:hypothetical protein
MRQLTLIILLAYTILGCNSNPVNKNYNAIEKVTNKCFTYPLIVDRLQVKGLYDSARWYIYTLQCDIAYRPKDDTVIQKTFGELNLSFDNLLVKGDTMEIAFNFTDRGKAVLSTSIRDFTELLTGVGYNLNAHKKIYMLSPNGFATSMHGGPNRYENPLQPEVLAYIKNNWDKLDPCFRALAAQKGLGK